MAVGGRARRRIRGFLLCPDDGSPWVSMGLPLAAQRAAFQPDLRAPEFRLAAVIHHQR